MLTFSSVSKSFDGHPALADVTLTVPEGSRTAVVGVNGSGKSTLLKMAAGLLVPDQGTVTRAPGTTVAYVPQDYGLVANLPVGEYLKQRAGLLQAEQDLRRLEAALDGGDLRVAEAYGEAMERYATLGGYEAESRIERALAGLGLPEGISGRRLADLSGGEQVRVGLAGLLATRCSLYLLDEPTNNLDLFALDLLERFVATADATFLVVSHDRRFLGAVATDVVEIDEHAHTAERFGVTFAEYRDLRERFLAARLQRYRDYTGEAARLQDTIRATRTDAGRSRDARPPRDHDKAARHFATQSASASAGKAVKALQRRLDRLEPIAEPRTAWELRLSLEATARSGALVADADRVVRRLGGFRLGPLSLAVRWRDRIALAGHNGAGKTVLLRLLAGADAPDSGTIRLGHGVRAGVLDQGGAGLAGPASGLATFLERVPTTREAARTLLAKFDLGADYVLRPTASYSPGERCRLGLAVLMAQGANWLILDEPTNHLDLEATEQLEQALAVFDGTLLVVSHDRELLDRVGITRRLELSDGCLTADVPV